MSWISDKSLSLDEQRRAEQEAKIYAEAQRKMLREEQVRADEKRKRDEADAEFRKKTALEKERSGQAVKAHIDDMEAKLRAYEQSPEGIAKRAEKVKSLYAGTREYLEARYGFDAYRFRHRCVTDECHNIYTAEKLIAERYSPDDYFWKRRENPQLEQLLDENDRKRAEYEPKCTPLRDFIIKLRAEQKEKAYEQSRPDIVRTAEKGSEEYLRARYGEKAYRTMLDTIVKELGVSEESAAVYMKENYSEELWKLWEDETIEQLLGNR